MLIAILHLSIYIHTNQKTTLSLSSSGCLFINAISKFASDDCHLRQDSVSTLSLLERVMVETTTTIVTVLKKCVSFRGKR